MSLNGLLCADVPLRNQSCASGGLAECQTCNREVAGSNIGQGATSHHSAFHTRGSANEYQMRLGRQRHVWLIPLADETQGVQVKL